MKISKKWSWWCMKYILACLTGFISLILPFQTFAIWWLYHWDNMVTNFSLASGVFMMLIMFLVITLVATEKVHRTLVVFFIAASLIFLNYTFGYFIPELRFLSLEQAFLSIDGEVIVLLVGMMMLVWVLSQTRLFEWIAVKMFEFSQGNILMLFFSFFIITAVFSAFLDNVTTIFLITPVAIAIAKIFEINPIRLVIPMIIASNIWGAATLIWDPPNIMIGSYAWLTFNQFLFNLWLPIIVISAIIMISLYIIMGKELRNTKKIKNFHKTVDALKVQYPIKHKKLLIACLSVFTFVIVFFFLHGFFDMPAAVPAIMWAALLMLIRDRLIRRRYGGTQECRDLMEHRIHNTFSKDIEWLVIGFFVFLFMIVGAVEHTWLLHLVAMYIQDTFGDNLLLCALALLWLAAIFSTILDNIPFTAVMLPVVASLVQFYADQWFDATFLWWSLAFWACFWWNWSLIGASANLVAAGILEKEKYYLSFMEFFKLSFPLMILQVSLASIAIYMMYLGTYS